MVAVHADDIEVIRNMFFENDVFGFHDTDIAQSVIEQPYQFIEKIHAREGPVALAPDGMLDGIDVARIFMLDRSRPIYCAFGFDAVYEALRQPAIFNQGYDNSFAQLFGGRVPPVLNAPEHTPYRGLINRAFGRMALDLVQDEVLTPAADALLDRIAADQTADLVPSYSAALPFIVISKILGLPADRFSVFAEQVRDLMAVGYHPEAGFAAAAAMGDYFSEAVDARSKAPQDDLISALMQAEIDGERLSRQDVISFCKLLTPAGMETTTRTLGNALVGLLTDPGQWNLLVNDQSLVPNAVEEVLRWEGPAMLMPKHVVSDTNLAGVAIPKGAYLYVFHGYANHDPGRWDRPHEFDITRARQNHVAFSAGPHTCAGNQLARREMETGLCKLATRFPSLRIDPEKERPMIKGFAMRSASHIHVELLKPN